MFWHNWLLHDWPNQGIRKRVDAFTKKNVNNFLVFQHYWKIVTVFWPLNWPIIQYFMVFHFYILIFLLYLEKSLKLAKNWDFFKDGGFWPFFGISDYTGKNVKNTIWKSIKSCILWKHSQAKISKYHTKMLKNQKIIYVFFGECIHPL